MTCRDIVTGALQLLGAYGGNETPSSVDQDSGMIALQSIYDGWVASGMFGRLKSVYQTSDYTANEGELVTTPSGVAVTLPTTVLDSCSNARAPRDLSLIEIRGDTRAVWLYDRPGWVQIDALALDDDAPLATFGQRGLMACLAVTVAGDFNMQVTPSIARLASQFRGLISLKLMSTQDPSPVEYM